MKRVGIYARVSTKDQNIEQQVGALREFCYRAGYEVVGEYIDEGASAMKANRKGFEDILDDASKRKIDIVLVHKLDRFGRSLKELVNVLEKLRIYGVDFISYSQREIDTTTPTGRLFFHQLAAFAEFERDMISERTKLRLQYLKDHGKKLGRPCKEIDKERIRELRTAGKSIRVIAKEIETSVGSVCRVLA